MPDYLHRLEFGTFITPSNDPATGRSRWRSSASSSATTWSPFRTTLPTRLPGHLDAADLGGRADRADPGGGQRAQCAAAAAGRAGPRRGQPRPAVGGVSIWPGRRADSGTRSRRWADPARAGAGGGRAEEAIDVIRGIWDAETSAPLRVRRRVPPRRRREAGSGAGARYPDLAGRLQAADAAAGRAQSRRLAALAGLPEAGRLDAGNDDHRRGGTAGGRDPREIRRHPQCLRQVSAADRGNLQGPAASGWRAAAAGAR